MKVKEELQIDKAPEVDRIQEIREKVYAKSATPFSGVEFELEDGTNIIMSRPVGGIMLILADLVKNHPDNVMKFTFYKALLHVQSINGEKVTIRNEVDVASVCNKLGEEGEDAVLMMYMDIWGSKMPTKENLKVLRKSL